MSSILPFIDSNGGSELTNQRFLRLLIVNELEIVQWPC